MQQSVCPVCGAAVSAGACFCVDCGAQLAQQPAPTVRCPSCGFQLDPGDAFCVHCGAALVAQAPGPRHMAPAPRRAERDDAYGDASGTVLVDQGQIDSFAAQPRGPDTVTIGVQDEGRAQPKEMPAAPQVMPAPNVDVPHVIEMDGGMTLGVEDDLSVRQRLLMISRDEAAHGCRKLIEVDGNKLEVNVPAGIDEGTKLDVEGWGYEDEKTHVRGPLRLSVVVM